MPEIHVLDNSTIDQIAAGEVIERPVSVVKELVENALDAGADAITVELQAGGTELIRVTDNGCGIPKEEVRVAFARHATSKILSAADLFALSSLGFRGEALSSIAAIARVELITRTAGSEAGTRYVIEGGEEKCFEEIGAPLGTSFYVRDLFFNTPVRRKFLKAPQSEAAYVVTLMEQLALSRPGIAMRLIVNGQVKLQTSGTYRMKDILFTLYGRETASLMQPLTYEGNAMRLEGYIGAPMLCRGNRAGELSFINGRFVKSPLIMKAIEQAYHGLTMQHKFPVAVLHLTMDPSLIDVNVHPTKMEVRFRNEKAVFDLVYRGIREALYARDQIPEVKEETKAAPQKPAEARAAEQESTLSPTEALRQPPYAGIAPSAEKKPAKPEEKNTASKEAAEKSAPLYSLAEENVSHPVIREGSAYNYRIEEDRRILERILEQTKPEARPAETVPAAPAAAAPAMPAEISEGPAKTEPVKAESAKTESAETEPAKPEPAVPEYAKPEQLDLFNEKILTPEKDGSFRLIGQVFDTYWLMEYEDQFLLADQHAVHEKILFERTMKALKTHEATSQQLQPPTVVTLSGAQSACLEKYLDEFEKLGFAISPLGGREYSISAVPDNLLSLKASELFLSLLDELGELRGAAAPALVEERVAMMSCKAAVKGKEHLSFAEAEALLKELLKLDNPYACPHGRPTMIRMSRRELEKKFKRIV